MSIIKIESGDWLKNAAIVGLIKVLSDKAQSSNDIKYGKNYIEFDSKLLEGVEEAYFNRLICENEKQLSWYKLIDKEKFIDRLLLMELNSEIVEELNELIDDFKKKLNSNSYKNAYLLLEDGNELLELEGKLNKIKLKKKQKAEEAKSDLIYQCDILNKIINYLKRPNVKRVITAKNVMYDVVQPFWTNVSFLLKTNNKADMYELYKNDFIDMAVNYVNKDRSKYKYTCFTCKNKISKLGKPEAFDLTWIVKTGVDMSRKSSHFWMMNGDAYICPICNLLYSCLPLGFITVKGKGIFINNNQSISKLKQSNIVKVSDEKVDFEEIEHLTYLNIVNSMEQYSIENFNNEFENIQVVKIDSNNTTSPYSFNILSKRLMYLIYINRKALNYLIKIKVKITDKYYINLYDEVVKRLYAGRNLFDLISQLMHMQLNGKFKGIFFIEKILKINSDFIGGKEMNYKETEEFKNYGIDLRKDYLNRNSDSKLLGITYRLLNALKTKDSSKFMDTLINSYMYVKKAIPTKFAKISVNQDLLQDAGYAFLIGLQGEIEDKDNKINEREAEKNEN